MKTIRSHSKEEKKALGYFHEKAKEYMERAKKEIQQLKESPCKESLLNLADYVVARNF